MNGYGCGLRGHTCACCTCTHAHVHAGLLVKSGDGIFRENIPSCGDKNTRASSLPFSPLPLPLTLCLQAEGGRLYLDEDAGSAGRCWQAVERKVCSLVLHRPPAVCAFALGLTEGKAVEPAWVEALVVGPACHLPLQWGHNGA